MEKYFFTGDKGGSEEWAEIIFKFFPLKFWLRVISTKDYVSFVSNLRPPLFPACVLLFPTCDLLFPTADMAGPLFQLTPQCGNMRSQVGNKGGRRLKTKET